MKNNLTFIGGAIWMIFGMFVGLVLWLGGFMAGYILHERYSASSHKCNGNCHQQKKETGPHEIFEVD